MYMSKNDSKIHMPQTFALVVMKRVVAITEFNTFIEDPILDSYFSNKFF